MPEKRNKTNKSIVKQLRIEVQVNVIRMFSSAVNLQRKKIDKKRTRKTVPNRNIDHLLFYVVEFCVVIVDSLVAMLMTSKGGNGQ